MRIFSLLRIAILTAFAFLWQLPAQAQTGPTPQQIQGMIADGQNAAALAALKPIVAAHPDSGVAWYLVAEAEDASGNLAAGRGALARAQQDAPGLPFASPAKAAALAAHLNGQTTATGAPQTRGGMNPLIVGIVVLAGIFFLLRMFFRRRRFMPPQGYQPGYNGPFPGGPQSGSFGYGGGMGGPGIGGSILGGLAAGAGFAAGERIIDGMIGGGGNMIDPANGQNITPDRDDGLTGNPGWTDDDQSPGDNGGGFDPGNSW